MTDYVPFSENQSKILSIASRTAASITFCCAAYMLRKTFQQRHRMFHRLMMGISIHLLSYAGWYLYGNAAVPADTVNVWGAHGTTQTCSAQGFFLQISIAIPLYYAFLSVYSYQAVLHDFRVEHYAWMEKWIHILANAFPFLSAIYLLAIEAYNVGGNQTLCWIESIPFGCGGDVPCERGPQYIRWVYLFFAVLPTFFWLLFPTVVMVCLYRHVLLKQKRDRLPANHPLTPRLVARQASVYLLAVYWTYTFTMINAGLQKVGFTRVFPISLLGVININLWGLWLLWVYRYFQVEGEVTTHDDPNSSTEEEDVVPGGENSEGEEYSQELEEGAPSEQEGKAQPARKFRVRRTAVRTKRNAKPSSVHLDDTGNSRGGRSNASRSTDFTIFDGTNASGAFSQFIFAGDSDDEALDQNESTLWSHVQDHV